MGDECMGGREYLTIQQVADYLSIKPSSLYSKIAEIPHYRIGRLLRFRKGEIDAWIETKRENSLQIETMRPHKKNAPDVNQIVRRAIDAAKSKGYNSSGKSDHSIKGLGKER
ncbi:helix-turn-helix domain-containing protein [Syntrophorhabdus aromaticivorans]|nr:helix-turn-helix domain-containing protein [Syntrophorhabdus aromaticivorans]